MIGTTPNMVKANLVEIRNITERPTAKVNKPRKNSAKVNEIAS